MHLPHGDETLGEALRRAAERLANAGCGTPTLDAELLLAEVLGTDRAGLVLAWARPVGAGERERFEALVRRREAREPVAYILGRKPFRHLEIAVDPRVLVPRPETELLVEVGLEMPRGARVVDVGTGSGAVALALEHERPDLRVTGVDSSSDALAVARENAARLGLDVAFARADLLDGAGGPFDAVLANLPYVAPEEWDDLRPEVHREPRAALVAEDGGLAAIRRLIAQAAGVPLLALEVGAGQATAVTEAVAAAGYADVEVRADLAGIDRVVVGRA